SVIGVTFLMGCKLLFKDSVPLASETNLHPPPFYTHKFTSPQRVLGKAKPIDAGGFNMLR
ncbi:MAG: hypothetical protein M1423_11235, partial [Acidobacteria bacterium]|nr:hypothetical protein [Acidobacteriota bacterium]